MVRCELDIVTPPWLDNSAMFCLIPGSINQDTSLQFSGPTGKPMRALSAENITSIFWRTLSEIIFSSEIDIYAMLWSCTEELIWCNSDVSCINEIVLRLSYPLFLFYCSIVYCSASSISSFLFTVQQPHSLNKIALSFYCYCIWNDLCFMLSIPIGNLQSFCMFEHQYLHHDRWTVWARSIIWHRHS